MSKSYRLSKTIINNNNNITQNKNNCEIVYNRKYSNQKQITINSKIIKSNQKCELNEFEMNDLDYNEAVKIDKRTYLQYYWSLLKSGHLFIFSFITHNDYNLMIIKICLFFFSFGLDFTVNALFFTETTMNKIFEEKGVYDFISQLPKIIYSNIISGVITLIIKPLSLPEKDVLKIKSTKRDENYDTNVSEIKKCLLIKFKLYFVISFIFLFIFWFYISCFCAVYQNTQLYLIIDTIISLVYSFITPFIFYLLPGIFRIPSLRSDNRSKECLYKISLLVQSI